MRRIIDWICCFLAIVWLLPALEVTAGHLQPFSGIMPPPKDNPTTPEKVELGKKLFFDRRLSGDGTMSCASCHIPEMGFADGQAISLSYPTTSNWRNAPTLVNVGLQKFLFHDGRAVTLEDQALFPMMSSFEMNQNLDFVEEEIRAVPEYREAFKKVFGSEDTSRQRIAMAIAAFERTIVSQGAPIDMFLGGEKMAFTPVARQGFSIFIGKGRCSECHFGANFMDDRFHALYVPDPLEFHNSPKVAATRRFVAKLNHYEEYITLTEDPGRYLITKDKKDWKAFRTPTLREITKTGPYMHNGVFETLAAVVDFFNDGGGKGNSVLKPLGLSGEEKVALVHFLTEAFVSEEVPFIYPRVP